jgi:hypothetical protein
VETGGSYSTNRIGNGGMMSYRMVLIDTLTNGNEVRIGQKSNGDFDISIGEETMIIPLNSAEDIAKYILRNT